MNSVELKNLISLFDDPDQEVKGIINNKLLSEGKDIIKQLSNALDQEPSLAVKKEILKKSDFLEREFALSDLKRSLQMDRDDIDFSGSLFLINKIIEPRLSKEEYQDRINFFSQQFIKEINSSQTALERVGIFNEIFYNRNSFRTTDFFYTDLKNSHIAHIIKTKEGSPISIAVLYMLFAMEVGLSVSPLCFHSGFVFCYKENNEALFYINAFREGEVFYENNLRTFIEDYGIEYRKEEFSLREPKVLLVMYTEMLHYIFMSSGNNVMMEIMERVLDMLGNERFMVMEEDDDDL